MPAEAVAITGGSILGLLLGGTAECRCTSRLIGSFRPSVRRNAKPRWSWSPVRRESCRRVGPATAERRPIVCIVDDRGIFGPVILHFRILRTGFAWELHGGHHQGSRVGRPHFEVRGAAYSSPGVQRAVTKPLCATAARAASLGRYSPAASRPAAADAPIRPCAGERFKRSAARRAIRPARTTAELIAAVQKPLVEPSAFLRTDIASRCGWLFAFRNLLASRAVYELVPAGMAQRAATPSVGQSVSSTGVRCFRCGNPACPSRESPRKCTSESAPWSASYRPDLHNVLLFV